MAYPTPSVCKRWPPGNSRTVRIGYFLSSEEWGPCELVSLAVRAQRAGFEDLWISDHYHPWLDKQGQSGFVWSVLGAIAAKTERLRVGTGVTCPMIRTHPASKRKSLFLASHAGTIVGWPMPEARAFLRDLTEHATQRQFVHAHRWRQYDLVMWDNRATMHRARRYDHTQVRDMRRTTIAGSAPTVEQVRAA